VPSSRSKVLISLRIFEVLKTSGFIICSKILLNSLSVNLTTSKILREINTFEREDGTPLHYTLINIKDWCKNTFEVVNQLRINTKNSFHRYDVTLLLNGLPLVQIDF
jgi:type I restriction enzyme R subunit